MKNQVDHYASPFRVKFDVKNSTLRLPPGVHSITEDTTITSGFTLKPDRGATVFTASGKTLTLECAVELMAGQTIANVFTGSGTVVFAGLLSPGMVMTTAQRQAISNPSEGLIVYDTDLNDLTFYNGTNWQKTTTSNAD